MKLPIKNSQGFSLIEVLVTLVLTVVGILGVLALQSKSIQYTNDAVNRNSAIALTNEFVEIMREHRDELFHKQPPEDPMYSQIKHTSIFYQAGGELNFTAAGCKQEQAGNAAEQASCWLKKVEANLPGAADDDVRSHFKACPSYIAGTCADASYTGSNLEVQVAWRVREGECMDATAALNGTVCTYTTRVEL